MYVTADKECSHRFFLKYLTSAFLSKLICPWPALDSFYYRLIIPDCSSIYNNFGFCVCEKKKKKKISECDVGVANTFLLFSSSFFSFLPFDIDLAEKRWIRHVVSVLEFPWLGWLDRLRAWGK